MGSSFSKELEIWCILGPLLFNTDIQCLFFIDMSSDILNYADDITPYECTPYYDKLKENLELQFTKYLIGSSIIISKLMLRNVIFSHRPISLVP